MVSGTSTAQADAPVDAALAQEFVQFCVDAGALRFGEFKTKAGRMSPYFFNAGLFDDGAKLGRLAQFYAKALVASGIGFDMIFGPAYKGIPLGAAVSIELARLGRNVPFAYNRKEAKDHGVAGRLAGALEPGDRVVVTEDAVTRGTSPMEAVEVIRQLGAEPVLILPIVDRGGTCEAMAAEAGVPFHPLVTAPDLGFPYEKDVPASDP